MRSRRGYTLAEVLVAAFVAALIVTAAYQLFIAGLRIYMRAEARSGLQSAGLVALKWMSNDLRLSAASTLTVNTFPTDPVATLAFQTQTPSGPPASQFQPQPSFVIYRADAGAHTLTRKIWGNVPHDPVPDPIPVPLAVPGLTPGPFNPSRRLTADEIGAICAVPNGTEQVMNSDVVRLSVSPAVFPDPAARDLQVVLTLELTTTVLHQVYDETVSTAVTMRNFAQPAQAPSPAK